ncbi:MAG: NAD(P)H-hydrate dehydratase [Planctomycetes bacterium]|nr:NAD(P)H-hydrate dehydratase [Planctomycetota bacterium]
MAGEKAPLKEVRDLPAIPPRAPDSHKGLYGRVLIAAGSPFMPGAAVLAARAAYRAGSGLVTVLTDTEVIPIVAAGAVEAVYTDWTALGEKLGTDEPLAYDACLVGPGLGVSGRGRLVLELIVHAGGPVIVDADALNLASGLSAAAIPPRDDRIWTPHPGEFQRLTGLMPRGDAERLETARRFVEERGGVLVLKGHRTVIVDRERYAINQTGNAGMATAGSGDVLAGILVALLGQSFPPFEAARLAAHLHGRAGDLAAAELGETSLTAGDLVDFLPAAIREHAMKKK